MPQEPLVSIIVATYNRASFLERSIRSILDQTYRNLECIVVDGASKDNSVEILQRLAAADSRLRFLSEPDQGEVYAVNKGLDMARGEIIGFQASDDYYELDAVEKAVEFLLANPQFAGVAGDARFIDPAGKPMGRGMVTYRGELSGPVVRRVLIMRFLMCPVIHGTFFGWREKLLKHGKLNPEFSVVPDIEYYTRVLSGGERIGCLPRFQVNYTIHPDMGAVKHYQKVRTQLAKIYERYGFRWYHHLARLSVGRCASYFGNPHRSPFFAGLAREIGDFYRNKLAPRR